MERPEHFLDLVHALMQFGVRVARQISEVAGEQELVFGLGRGASRDGDEPRELALALSAAAFSDVRRHGRHGAAELGGQAVALVAWETCGRPVDLQHERMSLLPHEQVPKSRTIWPLHPS